MYNRKLRITGRAISQHKLPLDEIEELNNKYEEAKNKLMSFGHRLAGRLDSELEFTNILQTLKIFKSISNCMNNHMEMLYDIHCSDEPQKPLHIMSCWVNDMKPGEYNPPHTHHDLTGWSTVLFLKIPEFINDVTNPHKFRDGSIGFIGSDGTTSDWIEPVVGDFLIFEARHQHCVMPFKTKNKTDIRRSMSFNFILESNRKDV
tara:strand:+ start:120 stop:731 length:612 start_codon:yes stop_codon:yes gene_type:complete